MGSSESGLKIKEARKRLKIYGPNEIAKKKKNWLVRLESNIRDPLSVLLLVLAVVSYLTADIRTAVLISAMLIMSIFLRFVQEMRIDRAAEKLKALMRNILPSRANGTLIKSEDLFYSSGR